MITQLYQRVVQDLACFLSINRDVSEINRKRKENHKIIITNLTKDVYYIINILRYINCLANVV